MADTSSARERWRHDLGSWAIPEDILAQAEVSPWRITPDLFEVDDDYHETVSDEHARDVVREGSRVLDVGCGAGVAAMALASARPIVVGLDRDPAMLERFEHNARNRGLRVETIEGLWPDVADRAPRADVVLAHHVVYNVADIEPFIRALDEHARARVVLELPLSHPMSGLNDAWRHFWGVERPTRPSADDLMAVLAEMGVAANLEQFDAPPRHRLDVMVSRMATIRLCLPASREGEVAEFLAVHPPPDVRSLACVWWSPSP